MDKINNISNEIFTLNKILTYIFFKFNQHFIGDIFLIIKTCLIRLGRF